MKQYLLIICTFLILINSASAKNLICNDNENNNIIKIFYDQNKIKALEKTFSDIFIFGNGMSGKFFSYKNLLGNETKIDEVWTIDLEFREPKTAVISKFKYFEGESKKIGKSSYLCQ